MQTVLLTPAARPLRFAGTGGTAGAVQLGLLMVLTHLGLHELAANAVAFLLAAQVNFALSATITWRERRGSAPLIRRWLVFQGSIAAMATLNMLVFATARTVVPVLVASALGIAAGATGNYLAGDRLVFRVAREQSSALTERQQAA